MNRIKTNLGWILVSLTLLVFFAVLFTLSGTVERASGQPYPPPPKDYVISLKSEIETYREMLRGDLDEQTRQSIEEKLAIAERMATQQSNAQPALKRPFETPKLIPVTDAPIITGILEGQGQEIRPSEANINNRWSGFVQDTYVLVLAGSLADDPAQGVIYVIRVSSDKKETSWSHYLTPTKVGSIRITDIEGTRLVLASELGTTLYFDVPSLQFASSLKEVIPPATPPFTDQPVNPYP